MWFGRKKKQTEQEKNIIEIVTKIISHKDTLLRVEPSNYNVFIKNERLHYTIVVLTNSVIITNTVFSVKEPLSEDVINTLKTIAADKVTKDIQDMYKDVVDKVGNIIKSINDNL